MNAPATRRNPRLGPMAEAGSDADGFGMDALRDLGDALSAGAMRRFKQDRIAVGDPFSGGGARVDHDLFGVRMALGEFGEPGIVLGHVVAVKRQLVIDRNQIVVGGRSLLRRASMPDGQSAKRPAV